MPVIIIDQEEIKIYPKLKEELKLMAKGVDEWDGTIIYYTVPEQISDLTNKLKAHDIAFHLKQF
jgi:hypothetical protein